MVTDKQKYWADLTMGLGQEDRWAAERKEAEAYNGAYNSVWTVAFNGEKNLGEMGPIMDYKPDYAALRYRSWQAYLDSEIAQTVIKKYTKWVIGSGLKLQAEPVTNVLSYEKIDLNSESFNEVVEARFGVFAKSKSADYAGMMNLHMLGREAFLNSRIGGDVLVILRYINNQVKVQLIDGANVTSPLYGNEFYNAAKNSGNTIKHGIELSSTGEHVAYYVKKGLFDVERVVAKGTESGLTMAFLVYGLRYRLDSVRGLPLISAVLETLKKLERYKEATLGSAEERQKIVYFIKHGLGSTEESPILQMMAKARNVDVSNPADDLPTDIQGKQLADRVASTTNKMAFNMPKDSELKSLESKNELHFKDFYNVNIDLVCAALSIPPNVAMSKYDSNFSASRAALKDWEHTLNVDRQEFAFQFYQQVYNFWLEIEILSNKVQAPGYTKARAQENNIVVDAYRTARFVGAPVPHIDPVKEVAAERAKLGPLGAFHPLTTVEAATEALNGGESDQNLLQFSEELTQAKKLGVVAPVVKDPTAKKAEQ
jgi:capsid protein